MYCTGTGTYVHTVLVHMYVLYWYMHTVCIVLVTYALNLTLPSKITRLPQCDKSLYSTTIIL